MTIENGTPENKASRIPSLSPQTIKYAWQSYELEEMQEAVTKRWLEEAYRVDTQADKSAPEAEDLPTDVLAGLYPEVAAFGVNGVKVAQTFQFFLKLNSYFEENESDSQAKQAFAHFLKEVYEEDWNAKEIWDANSSASNFFTVPHQSIRYKQIRVCVHNTMLQRAADEIHVPMLEKIFSRPKLHLIMEHSALVFVAQNPDTQEDPEVVSFTRHFNKQWEELRQNLAQTDFQANMPRLT